MSRIKHLAIIPDGNRRWAAEHGVSSREGHRAGITAVNAAAEAAWAEGVEVFSFWWGSPANLTKRDPEEVASIVAVLREWLLEDAPRLLQSADAQFEIHGRWRELCPTLADGVAAAQAAAGEGRKRFVLLMAYDGREEIREAAQRSGGDAQEFAKSLWLGHLPPVDLVIRTGDAQHLSAGFMLWHVAEARLHFSSSMWPAMTTTELVHTLQTRAAEQRKYGE